MMTQSHLPFRRLPKLFRRREIWLPTWFGAAWLLAAAALGLVALGSNAYLLLAPQQLAAHGADADADADGARTLVVEGWMDALELKQAITVAHAGHYDRVLTTGGPIKAWTEGRQWPTYAARAADYLSANGIGVPVIAVPAPASAQDRSYLSALMVRDWAQQSGTRLKAIDMISVGVHTRRSWLLYRMALGPDVEVGAVAVGPSDYDARRWWRSSVGVKTTVGELLSLSWTKCCFWPAPHGSHDERWAVPAASATP